MARAEVRAWRVHERGVPARLETVEPAVLGPGELRVAVEYSSLNYKDALALTARAPIARRYPLTCGIDLAGTVVESRDDRFAPGTAVVATGDGLGEDRDGGLATECVVTADSAVVLDGPLDARRAMALGTAGLSAALAVRALEHEGLTVSCELPVLVTGATGGVGSIAVALLAAAGHRVVAVTGKDAEASFLEDLGASEVLARAALEVEEAPALGRVAYAGAVDVVGGRVLANLVTRIAPHGAVAVLGLAGGAALETTVYPLILRGVVLHGVNAARPPRADREAAWRRLASELPASLLDELTTELELDGAMDRAEAIIAGTVRGRSVVRVVP